VADPNEVIKEDTMSVLTVVNRYRVAIIFAFCIWTLRLPPGVGSLLAIGFLLDLRLQEIARDLKKLSADPVAMTTIHLSKWGKQDAE